MVRPPLIEVGVVLVFVDLACVGQERVGGLHQSVDALQPPRPQPFQEERLKVVDRLEGGGGMTGFKPDPPVGPGDDGPQDRRVPA